MTAHRSDPSNNPEEESSHSKPNPDGRETGPEPLDRKHFQELADRWEDETLFLSSSRQAAEHPAYQAIISMGEPAVPLILERMQSQGGHWFETLQQITGEDPVSPADYGNIAEMQNSWLQWGRDHGCMNDEFSTQS